MNTPTEAIAHLRSHQEPLFLGSNTVKVSQRALEALLTFVQESLPLQNLVDLTLQWSEHKGITGAGGTGTNGAQANKMMEEATETRDAVLVDVFLENEAAQTTPGYLRDKIKDGIGDTAVTLIILARLYGWTLQECLQYAYDEIKGRTGAMVDGEFVRNK